MIRRHQSNDVMVYSHFFASKPIRQADVIGFDLQFFIFVAPNIKQLPSWRNDELQFRRLTLMNKVILIIWNNWFGSA